MASSALTVVEAPPGPPTRDATGPVVVVTGWRDRQRSRWIPTLSSAWHSPTASDRPVVALVASPGVPKLGAVLRDLVFALGKSPHVLGGWRASDGGLDNPAAWMLARRTKELIVNDATQLPASVTRALIELAAGVDARIWLIGHHNRAGALDEVVELYDATSWDLDAFDAAWQRPDRIRAAYRRPVPTGRGCDLPASSALTFRHDCRAMLGGDRFAALDKVLVTEFRTAMAEFTERAGRDRLDHESIGGLLRRRVRAAATTDDLVTTVRGIETAALRFGYTIDVELPVLLNAAERNPQPGRNTADDYAALDAYAKTAMSAACALRMCDVSPPSVIALDVADVDPEGRTVATTDGTLDIPSPLQPYLQAHWLIRHFDGAAPSDPFVLAEKGGRVTLTWVTRVVKVAEVECGIRLARPRFDRKTLTTFEWLGAHGLSIRCLADTGTRKKQR